MQVKERSAERSFSRIHSTRLSLHSVTPNVKNQYLFLLQLPLEKEEAKNAQSRRPKPAVIQNRTMSHSLPFPWPSDYEDPAATPLLPGSRTVLGPLTQGL